MPSAIRAEMEQLGQLGYKEVTLLGQNIDAYGRDLPGVTSEGVISIRLQTCSTTSTMCAGLAVRFATSHPRYFTERLIRACVAKVCEHFHIPFQSGDNEVLKRMAGLHSRKYRRLLHDSSVYAGCIN